MIKVLCGVFRPRKVIYSLEYLISTLNLIKRDVECGIFSLLSFFPIQVVRPGNTEIVRLSADQSCKVIQAEAQLMREPWELKVADKVHIGCKNHVILDAFREELQRNEMRRLTSRCFPSMFEKRLYARLEREVAKLAFARMVNTFIFTFNL